MRQEGQATEPCSPHPLLYRKQDFRELKQLQREEMKEATEFYAKIKVDREVQEKKFEAENAVSGKWCEMGVRLLKCGAVSGR